MNQNFQIAMLRQALAAAKSAIENKTPINHYLSSLGMSVGEFIDYALKATIPHDNLSAPSIRTERVLAQRKYFCGRCEVSVTPDADGKCPACTKYVVEK